MIGGMTMERVINEQYGFIKDTDLPELIEAAPDMMVLVRCGCGRFTCRMDQVTTEVNRVQSDDYVRDVCLPSDNHARVEKGLPYINAQGVVQR